MSAYMCGRDKLTGVAGTEQHAVLKPDVPNSWFSGNSSTLDQKPAMNSSRRRTNEGTGAISTSKSVKAVREIIEVDDFQDEDVFTGSRLSIQE